MSRSLALKGGNVDSIPYFYLRNHVGAIYLTFKSLSGHVRCLSLQSQPVSIKSLFDKSSKSFLTPCPTPSTPFYAIGYLKFSITCLWKTLCDNFYHEPAMKGKMDVIETEKGRATHIPARNRPNSPPSINVSIFSNQSLTSSNIFCFHLPCFPSLLRLIIKSIYENGNETRDAFASSGICRRQYRVKYF